MGSRPRPTPLPKPLYTRPQDVVHFARFGLDAAVGLHFLLTGLSSRGSCSPRFTFIPVSACFGCIVRGHQRRGGRFHLQTCYGPRLCSRTNSAFNAPSISSRSSGLNDFPLSIRYIRELPHMLAAHVQESCRDGARAQLGRTNLSN
jgi:hypothetical protein